MEEVVPEYHPWRRWFLAISLQEYLPAYCLVLDSTPGGGGTWPYLCRSISLPTAWNLAVPLEEVVSHVQEYLPADSLVPG